MNFASSLQKIAAVVVLLLSCQFIPFANAQPFKEEKIEAAMTIRLLSFTEWPEQDPQEDRQEIIIGVFEDREFYDEFRSLATSAQYQGRFRIRLIQRDASNSELDAIDALFFSETRPREITRMIVRVADRPVVLIGSFDGFIEMGGMVNFAKRHRKVTFEIDAAKSKRNGIEYRAKLLRLATRVIEE